MEDFLLGIISRSIIALHLWWIKCLCRYVTAVLHICWAGRSLFISWHILTLLTLNVGLLPYLININIGIYPVLNDVSFCFLETFLGCLYISSEYLPFPCMSVSLLFDSLSFQNYANIEFWMIYLSEICWIHSLDISWLFLKYS